MDDQPLDLSSLDRHADPERYRQRVSALAAAALAPAPHPILLTLVSRGRVGAVAAAVLALATWAPRLLAAREPPAPTNSAPVDPVYQLASWADAGTIPANANLLSLTGGPDAR